MNEHRPRKLISLVIPVLNEEANIFPLHEAVERVIAPLQERYDFEFVFTDNHSTDRTFEQLRALVARDARVRVLRFSRNFGYQKSILTGYLQARGDALIQLDCDLQDPPEMIPEFLRHWEAGCAVVYGVRRSRREGPVITLARQAFYRLVNALSEDELPVDAGDFRLIDRCVADVLRQVDDAQPYLRGMIAAMGFRQLGIPYDRRERERGSSNFRFTDLVRLGLTGIVNHSTVPLRLATFLGLVASGITFLAILGYAAGKFFLGYDWPAGFTTQAILTLAGISLNALFLGIIGEYIGRIHRQVKRQPLVIVEARLGDNEVQRRAVREAVGDFT